MKPCLGAACMSCASSIHQDITATIQAPPGNNSNHPGTTSSLQHPPRDHQELTASIQGPFWNVSKDHNFTAISTQFYCNLPQFITILFGCMGYILKDEETLDHVTAFEGNDTDVSSVMSKWGSIDICHLVGAPSPPPNWKESALQQVLQVSSQKQFLLTKMRWCVAEMSYTTWQIQAPDTKTLVGKVFGTQAKECQMMFISKEDYKQRRHSSTRTNVLSSFAKTSHRMKRRY